MRREGKYSDSLLHRIREPLQHEKTMHHTKVVHFEIPADNVERAKKFYKEAFGWDISQYPGMEYHMVNTAAVDEKTRLPKESGAINGGLTKRNNDTNKATVITVDVENIDNALKSIEKLGGKTVQKKQPVTDMGFTAYFKDPEGNIVGLWQSARRT